MKILQTSLLTILLPFIGSISGNSQSNDVLWQYDMSDGSTIHGMSDNGKWAVAYGVSDATSAYSFPKFVNFTTHTQEDILTETELNSGIECFVNDVSDDATVVAGCYEGKPAYWNMNTRKWKTLPLANGNIGGRIEAVTPDGAYGVGVCTNGGYDEVPVMWDIVGNKIITLENLPTCDLSGHYQAMTRFTGISADGRYIVGCVSYSYPSDILYFLYDRMLKTWDALAFDYNAATKKFTNRDEKVRTLDGITISPNGKWVAGIVYSTDDVRNPFRYSTETKIFENLNRPEDLDKGCVVIDNNGTLYAATPAVNPSRSLYILRNGYWYGIDEVLKQNYGIDFYTYTGYDATGLSIAVSADCKTMAGIAYITHENYQISLPTTFAEACDKVNLLDTYTASVRSGAKVQKLSNITLTFTRDIEVLAQQSAISLVDENGTVIRNTLKFAVDNTSSKKVSLGFRTTTLDANKRYAVIIPEGSICLKGDATKTNKQIVLEYVGLGSENIVMTQVSPTDKSTLGHIDINTNPVIFSFNVDVTVKEGAQALVYRNDETEVFCTLQMQHGSTLESYNMVLVYPTSTLYLYKDNTYRIIIPEASLTDAAGYATNSQAEATFYGSYERTIVSDDTHIYWETFESGMSNVMLYDGDANTPTSEMQAWNFTNNVPWIHAADDDYSNPCAASHSMYSPAGTSNDWMVTPQLLIPDEKCILTFDAQSYRKAKADKLRVLIYASEEPIHELDASIIAEMEAKGKEVVNKQLTPGNTEGTLNNEWEQFEISLAEYAGKNIYIAFVNQNTNQSAIFVSNVQVKHNTDFKIALIGVPEMVVAQQQQKIKGAIIINDSQKTYNSADIALINTDGTIIEQLKTSNLSLSNGDSYEFEFTTPLPLTIGRNCPFSIKVDLDNGTSVHALNASVKNLAFKPTKRVVLEENTGMGCQNCPLGHLALEYLEKTYKEQFIPIAYHTYTGDALESGMTDYAQYFLNLSAAPTAIIHRNPVVSSPMVSYTENGVTDYTFHSREGDTWLDLVSKELTNDAEADLSIGSTYDASTNKIKVDFAFTSALDYDNSNIGLLCVVTEDGLLGYQSNAFYTTTDADLGEWQKGGLYAKSTVYPYTFNDVARALYPSNAYNGQTGLIPSEINNGETYTGTITFDLALDAPYVKSIENCKVTCIAIDANTGKVINAARVKMGQYMTGINDAQTSTTTPLVTPWTDGVLIKTTTKADVTLYNLKGQCLTKKCIYGTDKIRTQHNGVILVNVKTANTDETFKITK